MTYNASLDTINKVSTFAVGALLVVVGGSAIYTVLTQPFPQEAQTMTYLCTALVIAALVLAYGFRPTAYSIEGGNLLIHRPFGNVSYSLSDIADVQQVAPGIWTGAFRLFGVGGFFGFYGKFWSSKHGRYTAYGTRVDNKLMITFKDGRKILVTPDSMEMMTELRRG